MEKKKIWVVGHKHPDTDSGCAAIAYANLKNSLEKKNTEHKVTKEYVAKRAGSLNADINIGDLVISTDLVHHDMNAVAFGYPVGQIPQMEAFSFRSDETLRKLAVQACRDVNPDIEVYEGRIASGDQFVADQGVKDEIIKNFDACAVEMEGAAIAQAAYLNNVPFLVVRAISDKADGSAEVDYPTFEALAVEHCVKMTLRILNQIKD